MPPGTQEAPSSGPQGPVRPLVLVVDDDPVILMTISVELHQAGFRVAASEDAEEALSRCAAEMPDVVISDYCLPKMSGAELSTRLNVSTYVPVIFLSAFSDPRIVTEAIAAGAFVYLVKPIDPPHLLPVVQAALHRAGDLRAGWLARRAETCPGEDDLRTISVVTGILMERFSLNHIDAYHRLRQFARSQRIRVIDLAANLLDASNSANLLLASIQAMPARAGGTKPPTDDDSSGNT